MKKPKHCNQSIKNQNAITAIKRKPIKEERAVSMEKERRRDAKTVAIQDMEAVQEEVVIQAATIQGEIIQAAIIQGETTQEIKAVIIQVETIQEEIIQVAIIQVNIFYLKEFH